MSSEIHFSDDINVSLNSCQTLEDIHNILLKVTEVFYFNEGSEIQRINELGKYMVYLIKDGTTIAK